MGTSYHNYMCNCGMEKWKWVHCNRSLIPVYYLELFILKQIKGRKAFLYILFPKHRDHCFSPLMS